MDNAVARGPGVDLAHVLLRHGGAQVVKVTGIHREQAAEDDRLDFLVARQGLVAGALVLGDRVADSGFADFLDRGDKIADFAGA